MSIKIESDQNSPNQSKTNSPKYNEQAEKMKQKLKRALSKEVKKTEQKQTMARLLKDAMKQQFKDNLNKAIKQMVIRKKNEIIAENLNTNRFAYNSLKLTDRYHMVRAKQDHIKSNKYPEKV